MPVVSKNVTVATSDTLVDGPKIVRSYVGIQNKDANNNVSVTFGGATATLLNGLIIGPGEFFDTHAPFNGTEIRAIADTGACEVEFLFGS